MSSTRRFSGTYAWHAIIRTVPYLSSLFGFLFGFGFGVGCALAVMYSIYLGGYRAAVKEAAAAVPSARLLKERKRLESKTTS